MTKFFDELMESVREMDEMLRGERAPSRVSKVDAPIQKAHQDNREQSGLMIENPERSSHTIALHWIPAPRGL